MTAPYRRLSRPRPMPAWQRVMVGVATGLLAGAATLVIGGQASSADTAPASSSPTSAPPGTVAGVPATSSEVTVSGRGEFSNMKFTVSQTKDLVNQAIGISWTGGAQTNAGLSASPFFSNFVQIMECWGSAVTDDSTPADADNDIPANPGPPREQCEYGGGVTSGEIGTFQTNGIQHVTDGFANNRDVTFSSEPVNDQSDNLYTDGEVPFRAVDGTVVTHDVNINTNAWQNPYYDVTTTNEIPYSYTYPDGTGSAVFTADTGLEAPGLGCGQPVTSGSSTPRDCWLVIVPRGDTNPVTGQPLREVGAGPDLLGSPLASVLWQDRIAIPLDFQLVSNSCSITAAEHETAGSELVSGALTSWQTALCGENGTVIGYSSLSDDQTRQQLSSSQVGAGELGFVSRPADPSTIPAGLQIAYAPVTLSGVTISFLVDSTMGPGKAGPPITEINLTPRLVAKLLTDSYKAAGDAGRLGGTEGIAAAGTPKASAYSWLANNPTSIFTDPDFLQANPQLQGTGIASGGPSGGGYAMVELNGSDAAFELWSWILADPSARAFLDGQPDPWGMTVDPYFSTSAKLNPDGTGLSLPSSTFPDPDPWSGILGATAPLKDQPPLGMTDIDAYIDSMSDVALDVASDNTTAKTEWNESLGAGEMSSYSNPWQLSPPGDRAIMGVTTTDSSDKFGVIAASLENAAGNFVAPSTASLLAGEAAMEPSGVPGVLQPDFATTSPDAYPLSMLTYAAVPLGTVSMADCAAYSALLAYAAGPGQTAGVALGDLPLGYAPLPAQLTAQTQAVAAQVAACPQTPATGSGAGSSPSFPATSSTRPGTGAAAAGPRSAAAGPGTAGSGAIPAGGPAGISESAQLTGGITPAGPGVFGYALPIGAATGLLAGLGAPLLGRRRELLSALRLPALPHPARFPGGLQRQRRWPPAGWPRRPWGRGRGSP